MKRLNRKEALKLLVERTHNTEDFVKKAYLSRNEYLLTDSGKIIEVPKGSIASTMYYDDEYSAPSTKLESFRHYNHVYHGPMDVTEWETDVKNAKTSGCWSGHLLLEPVILKDYDNVYSVYFYMDSYDQQKFSHRAIRLNAKETTELVTYLKEIMSEYDKRIDTYYKKYADKITTYGYWANR